MMVEQQWNQCNEFKRRMGVDEIDLLYGKLFKSSEGQKVLNHLRAITIEQPTWYPGEDASYGYAREGMAELVRKIEKRVGNSNNG